MCSNKLRGWEEIVGKKKGREKTPLLFEFCPLAELGAASASPLSEEVQRVRLSRSSCMMSVLSQQDSPERESSSAIASSRACLARWQARSGEFRIS